jgi:hypothetical protein
VPEILISFFSHFYRPTIILELFQLTGKKPTNLGLIREEEDVDMDYKLQQNVTI